MEYNFIFAYGFILVVILFSMRFKLGIEKELFTSSIKAFLQLLIMGYALLYIFALENVFGIIAVMLFMLFYASYIASKRVIVKYSFFRAVAVLSISSTMIIGFLLLVNIISLKPQELIPLFGMVVGNGLNVYNLFLDKFSTRVKDNFQLIEAYSAIGTPLHLALRDFIKSAIKNGLIPVLNSLSSVGFVLIPGITVGMILAGANPLKAVTFQIVIMYMMVSIAFFSSILSIIFHYDVILNIETEDNKRKGK